MQSYDEYGNVVHAEMLKQIEASGVPAELIGDSANVAAEEIRDAAETKVLYEKISEVKARARARGAVRHVVANFPEKNQEYTLGGLVFFVKGVNPETGEVHLKLKGM